MQLKSEMAEHARTLISSELALMKDAQIEFFKSVKAGGATVDVSTVTKILEAAKTAQPKLPATEK